MSGPLNSEAPGCSAMLSLPSVASLTSLANAARLMLCGLSGGYAEGRFHLLCAGACVVAITITTAAASITNMFRLNITDTLALRVKVGRPFLAAPSRYQERP